MGAIYHADVWCDDCADDIKSNLQSLGADPVDYDDESVYDSDEYPKWYDEDTEESDYPQHCAGCRRFLENPLTTDGMNYVRDTVRDDVRSGHTDSVAVTEWFPYYSNWLDFSPVGHCDGCEKLTADISIDGYCESCEQAYDAAQTDYSSEADYWDNY